MRDADKMQPHNCDMNFKSNSNRYIQKYTHAHSNFKPVLVSSAESATRDEGGKKSIIKLKRSIISLDSIIIVC